MNLKYLVFLVRPLQEYYIIAPGHIYQAPDAAAVISHRLVNFPVLLLSFIHLIL